MKKLAIGLYAAITVALMVWGFYQAIYVAPDEQTMHEIQRIFYYHVPSAMVAFLFFAISLAGSIGFLAFRRNRPEWAQISDAWALAGAEVGVVFCTVVLITGPIWGRRAWGIWWTWDARLTTTLVLWLIYVSYLLLRRFAAGPQVQTLAAVLGIFGALDVPIVYMSNRWWRTQHPAPVFGGGPDSGIKDPACWPPSAGTSWPGWPGASSSSPSATTSSASTRRSPPQEAQAGPRRLSIQDQKREEKHGHKSDSRSPVHRCRLRHHLGHPTGLSGLAGPAMARAKARRGPLPPQSALTPHPFIKLFYRWWNTPARAESLQIPLLSRLYRPTTNG